MIYTCLKYQGETPLNNQYAYEKMKDRKTKHILSRGGYSGSRRRVKGENEGG
jgi:hypothetical protein